MSSWPVTRDWGLWVLLFRLRRACFVRPVQLKVGDFGSNCLWVEVNHRNEFVKSENGRNKSSDYGPFQSSRQTSFSVLTKSRVPRPRCIALPITPLILSTCRYRRASAESLSVFMFLFSFNHLLSRVYSPLKPPLPVHSVPFAPLNPETCWFTLKWVTEPSVATVIDTDNSFSVFVSSMSSCLSVERIKAFGVFFLSFFLFRECCLLSVALTACSACQTNDNEFIKPKQFPKEYL